MASEITRIYVKRWFILAIFCCLSMTNGFQSLQYTIINDLLMEYYHVSSLTIDWTSMIYMVLYVLFIFPAMWFLDRFGLRLSLIVGAFGNCLGAWIKCGSANPYRFYVSFIGQIFAAASQVFILEVPPRLAAVWFGPRQVSTATAIGVFGNQFGCALGFLIPPMVVKNVTNGTSETFTSIMTTELEIVYYGTAGVTTASLILIIFFLTDKPPVPPSLAQLTAIKSGVKKSYYWRSLKKFVTQFNYMLLVVAYAINVGGFYTVSTLLNPVLIEYFPGEEVMIGWIGLIIILGGLVGAVLCGIWLDKTKRYKSTICIVYACSFIGMLIYTFTISLGQIWIVFVVAAILGFFTTGYLPLGFEYACELTYPLPEGTSSGLLSCAAQLFGFILTLSVGNLLKTSALYCNLTLSIALAVGTIITFVIKADLRRQKAEVASSNVNLNGSHSVTSNDAEKIDVKF